MKENWRLREKIRVIDSRETLCFNDFSSWTTSVPLSFFTSWGCLLAELETWGTMREKRSKISRRRREEVRDEEEQPALSWEDHLYREKNKTASFQNEGCVVVTSRDWICLCSISWRIKSQSAYHVQWKNEEEILSSFFLSLSFTPSSSSSASGDKISFSTHSLRLWGTCFDRGFLFRCFIRLLLLFHLILSSFLLCIWIPIDIRDRNSSLCIQICPPLPSLPWQFVVQTPLFPVEKLEWWSIDKEDISLSPSLSLSHSLTRD